MAYPKVFFSLTERLEPRVVRDAHDEALLTPGQWTTLPPQPRAADEYPKLYANPNVWPVIVHNPGEVHALGADWRPFDLTPFLPAPTPPAGVSINPTSSDWPIGSASASFYVTVNSPGYWKATKEAPWVTITSPTDQQTDSGRVEYLVAANAGPARTANIYVNDQIFVITQAGV